MKNIKNIMIILLLLAFGIIMVYGLMTWTKEGKSMSAAENKNTAAEIDNQNTGLPEIKITSDTNFTADYLTNGPVELKIISSNLKMVYNNGVALDGADEVLVQSPGAYEIIAENNDGSKSRIHFTIDPAVQISPEKAVKGSDIKSEVYTGDIKPKVVGPVIKAQYPESLVNGGTVNTEMVTLVYTSNVGIASVTLDGELMEMNEAGTLSIYTSGTHTVTVMDTKGTASNFVYTNNY